MFENNQTIHGAHILRPGETRVVLRIEIALAAGGGAIAHPRTVAGDETGKEL